MIPLPLPSGIRQRVIAGINGLDMHVLEAGFEVADRPCVLLLHGFPELAYSWRKVMAPLAEAGFYVVAPDQRGYGQTTGWDGDYSGDVASFRLLNLVRDMLGLVWALGLRAVAAVVGHDFGSPVAAWCALVRPDVFKSVMLMSAPFAGAPPIPGGGAGSREAVFDALERLDPPRMHYQRYYGTPGADAEMRRDLSRFMRAYYHVKSADWPGNMPVPLAAFSATELARLPEYYVMEWGKGMAETVAGHHPAGGCAWLPDEDLAVYISEFRRTGFQGGLNWYRCVGGRYTTEQEMFAGRGIQVPAGFLAGARDWGVHQMPGAFETMQSAVCADWRGARLLEGAGHWVQQERPEEVARELLTFLGGLG